MNNLFLFLLTFIPTLVVGYFAINTILSIREVIHRNKNHCRTCDAPFTKRPSVHNFETAEHIVRYARETGRVRLLTTDSEIVNPSRFSKQDLVSWACQIQNDFAAAGDAEWVSDLILKEEDRS